MLGLWLATLTLQTSGGDLGSYQLLWRRPLIAMGVMRNVNASFGQPAMDSTSVYAATGEGSIVAVSVGDGSTRWVYNFGEAFEGPVQRFETAAGTLIVAGSTDGTLVAVSANTGALVWKTPIGGSIQAPAAQADSLLVATTSRNQIVALDAGSGSVVWQRSRPAPTKLSVNGHAAATLADGVAYTTFADGYAAAYRVKDGTVLWTRPLSLKGGEFIDADADPQVAGSLVFVASYSDGVYALQASSGQTAWTLPEQAVTHLTLNDNKLWATTGDGGIVRISLQGEVEMRTKLNVGFASRMTTPYPGVAVFAAGDAGLVSMDLRTGKPLGNLNFGSRLQSDVFAFGDHVAAIAAAGHLYLFTRRPSDKPAI